MQRKWLLHTLCASALLATSVAPRAREITLTHTGIVLNASLELAGGKTPADGVIVITHGALAHRDMELITYLRKLFKERGYSTLAINLSLGLDDRHGMFDCRHPQRHRNADAVQEIGVWLDWLHTQGARRVTLLGHSRGGAQTALYAAEHDSTLIHAVVLMAPATRENTDAKHYHANFDKPLAPLLLKAQQLAAQGRGDTLLEHVGFLTCRDTSVSADGFVSYYSPDPRLDSLALLSKIKKPTCVVVAGSDNVVVGLAQKLDPLPADGRVEMTVVDAAGHLFRDLYADDAVDAIDAFLQNHP